MPDLSTLTACGECCTDCAKKAAGACPGCIEADGFVPEWAQSGRCKIHACARANGVTFCGLCKDFPCENVGKLVHWNPNIIGHMQSILEKLNA